MYIYSILRGLESKLYRKGTAILIIAVVSAAAYSNSFTVPYLLDDFSSIQNNYAIHRLFDFAALWKFYSSRIVLYSTFSVDYFVHGNAVPGYHITNLVIHILNGILLYLILRNLLGLDYFKGGLISSYRNTVSLAAAVIFVSHPIQVNAVTYIVQRTASLAAMFCFLAILFYIKYRIHGKTWYFALTMLFILLAMFTKENTITLPFMLILIELFFFSSQRSAKGSKTRWYKRLVIMALLLATAAVIPFTVIFLKGYSQSDPSGLFKASTTMDRMQYLYTEFNVILLYIRLMFIPDRQNFDYSNDFPISATIWDNYSYFSFLILLLIGLCSLLTLKRNRLVSLGIIWFFMGLAAESTIISIKDVYFEHRLYLPCAGFAIFLMGMLFYERKPQTNGSKCYLIRKPLIMLFIVMLISTVTYTGLTLKRNYIYSSSIRLWSDVISKAPGSDRAHSALATGFLNTYDSRKGNVEYLDLAETEFKKSITINYYNSTAHCNLSKVYLLLGDYGDCIDEAKKTLAMTKSEYADYNLGQAYEKLGKKGDALEAYLEGYRTNSRSTFILQSLGNLYYKLGDYKSSRFYYENYLKNIRGTNSTANFIKKRLADMEKKGK